MFNVPEQAAFQVRVVDANDPIEVYAETVFMAMPGCEGDARYLSVPNLSFNGDAFGLINREVTLTAFVQFDYQGQPVLGRAEHTGPVEVR